MTTIWSLKRRNEVPVRVYYSVAENAGRRLLTLEQIERFDILAKTETVTFAPTCET